MSDCPQHPTYSDGTCTTQTDFVISGKTSSDCTSTDLTVESKHCSVTGVDYDKCVADYSATGQTTTVKKCTLALTGGQTIELTDNDRLEDKTKCEVELKWSKTCDGSVGGNESDCEVKGSYTAATAAACVEKQNSKSSGGNLYFKFALVFIISLLF